MLGRFQHPGLSSAWMSHDPPWQRPVVHAGVQGAPKRRADRLAMRRALELHQSQRPSLDGSPATATAAAAAAARPFGAAPPDSPPADGAPPPASATETDRQLNEAPGLQQAPAGAAAVASPAGPEEGGGEAVDLKLPRMARVISVGDCISDVGGGSCT